MKHFKNICLIVLLLAVFSSCTEIYTPNVSSETEALVVEGLITDGAGPFTVKLSMAEPLPYDSVDVTRYTVRSATVTITDSENKKYVLKELTPGNYSTPSTFKTKIGNFYKINIKTTEGNSYESGFEKLLSPLTIDSIRGIYSTEDYINDNAELLHVDGADIRVDLFNTIQISESVPSCRFKPLITTQYWYTYRDKDILGNDIMSYHWANFGWKTYKLNTIENITDEKVASSIPLLKNHSIGFIPFDMSSYGHVIPQPIMIYYLRVNQYTLNNDSYNFYKGAKNQLSASGKIFDPITSQLHGNMRCVNDPSKIVLGLFEVSSVKEYAFLMELEKRTKHITLKNAVIMDVPAMPANDYLYGDFQYKVWDYPDADAPKNDPTYDVIPFPGWWYHN
ncbi:MAG: DUF4249 domain-containing protein [Paludibacter sp.]